MSYYISALNSYYEGDRIDDDLKVEQRPSPNHDWINGEWVLDLVASKTIKKQDIEGQRDDVCTADVVATIGGVAHPFQSDKRSQDLVIGALVSSSLGIAPVPAAWRSSDNVMVAITVDDLKSIGLAMVNQTSNAYHHSWDLKAAVDAATEQSQLDAIVW